MRLVLESLKTLWYVYSKNFNRLPVNSFLNRLPVSRVPIGALSLKDNGITLTLLSYTGVININL